MLGENHRDEESDDVDGNQDNNVDDNNGDDVDGGNDEDYVDGNYENGDDGEFRSRTGTVRERHMVTGRPIRC